MKASRFVRRAIVAVLALAGVLTLAAPAEAGPYWTGCRPYLDPETLEISTLCY